jgi:hypothetical protein
LAQLSFLVPDSSRGVIWIAHVRHGPTGLQSYGATDLLTGL